MTQYHIFHATSELRFTETEIQPREYVGFVEAKNVGEAFRLSQNLEGDWNPSNPCRSTSVGDVIQQDNDFFMVCGLGFKCLDDNTDDSSEDLDRIVAESLGQQMLDNPENYGLI